MEFSQKLLFVTGKGGTGKSFLSAILAVRFAQEGKKVLVVDAEATGTICEHFEQPAVGYEPEEIYANVFAMKCRTDEALSEYLKINAHIPTWTKITPLARLIDLVSNAAPGVKEILVTGKICFEAKRIRESDSEFDIIIVDAPSSGHVVSLLDAPRALADLVSRGMIQSQTKWMQEILSDKIFTGVVVATTSDEVVLTETKELLGDIEENTNVNIAGVIINKDIANPAGDELVGSHTKTNSKRVNHVIEFYESKIALAHTTYATFGPYETFSMPFILDNIPSLRTLKKYAQDFRKVKVDTT